MFANEGGAGLATFIGDQFEGLDKALVASTDISSLEDQWRLIDNEIASWAVPIEIAAEARTLNLCTATSCPCGRRVVFLCLGPRVAALARPLDKDESSLSWCRIGPQHDELLQAGQSCQTSF